MKTLLLILMVLNFSSAFAQTEKKEHVPVTEDPYKAEAATLQDCIQASLKKFIKSQVKNKTIELKAEIDERPANAFLPSQKSCRKLNCDDLVHGTEGTNFKMDAVLTDKNTKVRQNYAGCAKINALPIKNEETFQIEKYSCSINILEEGFRDLMQKRLDYSDASQMMFNLTLRLDQQSNVHGTKVKNTQIGNPHYKCEQ